MQHWTPDDDAPTEVRPPSDAWSAWLNRPPLHDVAPPPPAPPHWTGIAVGLGLAGFWVGVLALGWTLLG